MTEKMRNVNRWGFDWQGFRPVKNRLIVRAMDEKDFNPDYSLGTVQDNYDNALAFEVVSVGSEVMDIVPGDIVAIISPALDDMGTDRYYSCTDADVIGVTSRKLQPPLSTEEELKKRGID